MIWTGCELVTLGVCRHLDGPMIVSGLDRLLVQVLDLLPPKSQMVLYWIAHVIELPHLWVGSYGAQLLG